ncbi:TonB-dependent receptor, partial [Enterobacter hormaechei]
PPARVQNNDRHSFDNWGAYVQAVYQPVEAWKIVPAYRVDRFSGRTHLMNGITARLQDYGSIGQPKLSIIHSLGQTTHVYANWGRTFQVLTG